MLQEVMFSGFGGQGVLTIAKNLSYTAMLEGKQTCWMPTYGPEMRGGTCGCTVSVINMPVSSPILERYSTVVALNQPSLDKYESKVKHEMKKLLKSGGLETNTPFALLQMIAYPVIYNELQLLNKFKLEIKESYVHHCYNFPNEEFLASE